MKKKFKWFTKSRVPMLFSAIDKVLYSKLTGEISKDELIALIEHIESFNIVQDDSCDEMEEEVSEQLLNEIAQAMVGEAVQAHDNNLINHLIATAKVSICIDLSMTDETKLSSQVLEHMKKMPIENSFIISSPLYISMLQCCPEPRLIPKKEGAFRGPNNSMEIGTIKERPVYSSIFDQEFNSNIIVGYYDNNTETFITKKINIINFSLI